MHDVNLITELPFLRHEVRALVVDINLVEPDLLVLFCDILELAKAKFLGFQKIFWSWGF